MRVLLVEDSPALQDALKATLKAIPGLEFVMVAATAQQATRWLDDHPDGWDLALVDLFLAEGHGFQVLRHCRKVRPHQRAVVLSNYTRVPVARYASDAGADAFFDKSLDMEALVDYITNVPAKTA
jgi:two-component system, OmpR family, response regulator